MNGLKHGLRTPSEEIAFTARSKIKSQSQIYTYGRSIFCLPHRPKISGFFDLCLHWVSVVRKLAWYNICTLARYLQCLVRSGSKRILRSCPRWKSRNSELISTNSELSAKFVTFCFLEWNWWQHQIHCICPSFDLN